MDTVQLFKTTATTWRQYKTEMVAGGCLIASVGLLVMGILQIHFSQACLHWVRDFTPRVLQPLSVTKMVLIGVGFTGAGAFFGSAIFFLKCSLIKRLEKNEEEKKEEVQKPYFGKFLRELRFGYCLAVLISILVGAALMIYGTQYLLSLKHVVDLGANHQFYLVGYLDQGHGIELALAAVACGTALFVAGLMEAGKKLRERQL